MNTATLEKSKTVITSFEDAKASLVQRFIARINETSESRVIDAAKLEGDKALAVLIQNSTKGRAKPLSVKARNEIALATLRANAFEELKSSYDVLDSTEVCSILGISKQALSKKIKAGQVIAFTQNKRKYYPDFQFDKNKVSADIGRLIKSLDIDLANESMINYLILFLAQAMDFSNPGEAENLQPRYKLIGNNSALKIIIRDFKNRAEMGK